MPGQVKQDNGSQEQEYVQFRAHSDLRTPYRLEPEFLQGTKEEAKYDVPETPLIVFINVRSGGRVGPRLADDLSRALGKSQVFNLAQYRPEKVLKQLWTNLREQEEAGDPRAGAARRNLRILVCGGDGTIAWIMKAVKLLDLQPHPPIAIMPLGTGNDLARTFNWGEAFEWKWVEGHKGLYKTLNKIARADVASLDCWNLRISLPLRALQMTHTYALTELEYSSAPPSIRSSQPDADSRVDELAPAPHTHHSSRPSICSTQTTATNMHGPASSVADGESLGVPAAASVAGSRAESMGHADAVAHLADVVSQPAESTHATLGSVLGSGASNASMASGQGTATTAHGTSTAGGGHLAGAAGRAPVVMEGMFWNYFSVGADAQAAFGFHHLRDQAPGCAASRLQNQCWYSWFSCSSGWFCGTVRSVNKYTSVEVLQGGTWRPLKVPSAVKALVLVNLQSYGGGRNLWGPKTTERSIQKHGWHAPTPNDGAIEVVGFKHGFHAAAVMSSKGSLVHGKRLAQAQGVRLALRESRAQGGAPASVYLQVDGEPWRQKIPAGPSEPSVLVEIMHAGVSKVLKAGSKARGDSAHQASKTQQQGLAIQYETELATAAANGVPAPPKGGADVPTVQPPPVAGGLALLPQGVDLAVMPEVRGNGEALPTEV